MSTIGERLKAHWLAQSLHPPPGVAEERLREFEDRHGVTLPPDLRGYLLHVDGMGSSSECDDNFFCFWPLGEIGPASEQFMDQFLEDQASYFVFADYSIRLPSYAIRLTPSGAGPHQVIAIYSDSRLYLTEVVAHTFSEFVESYLTQDFGPVHAP